MTTAGMIMFGAIGAIVAAPFLKIVIDAHHQLKAAGLFGAGGADGGAGLPGDLAADASIAPPPDAVRAGESAPEASSPS